MYSFNSKTDFDHTYIEYQIQNDDIIDTFSEGMIKNNSIQGIIPMTFQQVNDHKYYQYDITNLISLDDFLKRSLNKKDIIDLILQIIHIFENGNDYMIEHQYFILDRHSIYIEQSKKEVYMIVLPLENIQNNISFNDLIRNILMSAKYQTQDSSQYVVEILNYINSDVVHSLQNIKDFLMNIMNTQPAMKVKVEPSIQQPAKERHIVEKEVLSKDIHQEVPPVQVQPSIINKETKIPTLQKKKIVEQTKEKPETQKKRGLFKKKETKEKTSKTETKRKIPSLGSKKSGEKKPVGRSSIPTLKKRKEPDINGSISGSLNDDIQPTYDKKINTGEFAQTTVLGLNEGTTVLSEGTTVLNDEFLQYVVLKRISSGQLKKFTTDVITIGKDTTNDFILGDNNAVSRKHAEIKLRNGVYYITDLNSTNHTYVDGQKVFPGQMIELYSGSMIKVANEDIVFTIG